jgi:hypothetical protein
MGDTLIIHVCLVNALKFLWRNITKRYRVVVKSKEVTSSWRVWINAFIRGYILDQFYRRAKEAFLPFGTRYYADVLRTTVSGLAAPSVSRRK